MKNKEQIAKIWDVLDSLNVDVLHNKQAIIKLENEREQPKLKQIDQSIFDGLDKDVVFASIDEDGRVFGFDVEPKLTSCEWDVPYGNSCQVIAYDYDTSNWKNSLIEREKVELTGSDLTRAMLERGDKYVMCMVDDGTDVICDLACFVSSTHPFIGRLDNYKKVTPINNQGEPLTQSDVGL